MTLSYALVGVPTNQNTIPWLVSPPTGTKIIPLAGVPTDRNKNHPPGWCPHRPERKSSPWLVSPPTRT